MGKKSTTRSKSLKEAHKKIEFGFKKGMTPWNKELKGFGAGVKRHSYNRQFRNKISNHFKGKKPWNIGLTKETDSRLKNIGPKKGEKLTLNHREKISKTLQGENKWKGFLTYKNNREAKHLKFREEILKRDNSTCICGYHGNIVHHIDYDNYNDIGKNVITLCKKCHSKTNSNRQYWKDLFKQHLNKKKYKGVEKCQKIVATAVIQ